jgi:hypothetical protein
MHIHPAVRKWALRLNSGFNWLFLGGLLFVTSWFLWQRWEIRSLKHEVRSLGLPTDREELDRFYVVPAGVLDSSADWNPALSAISDTMKESASKELQPFICDPTKVPLPGEQWDLESQAVAFLNAHVSDLKALHHASSLGGQTRLPIDYKLDFEKFETFNDYIRGAIRLLQLEAGVAAYQGEPARCRAAQKNAVDLYLAIQGQPDVSGFLGADSNLSRIASTLERLLIVSQWSDAELALLQQKLCSIDYRQQLKLAIAGHCVSQSDIYGAITPIATATEVEVLRWSLLARQSLDHDWPTVLRLHQEMADQKAAVRQNRSAFAIIIYGLPAPYEAHLATWGALAEARRSLVNVGLAVHRFRLRHGRLPGTLAEIDTDLIGKCADRTPPLTDPLDGRPIRYLIQPDRCLIYSVGVDKLDNGGDVDFDDTGDSRKRPLDIGFSVLH